MLVEISYRGTQRAHDADAHDYTFDVVDWRTQDHIRSVVVRVADINKVRLSLKYGAGDQKAGAASFQAAMLRVGVRRIEAAGRALLDDLDVPLLWLIDGSEVDAVGSERKQCTHQQRRGSELFCLAAERWPAAKDTPPERRACTTLSACEKTCGLPDTGLLCSGFAHLQMIIAHPYPPSPIVGPRVCDKGHQQRIEQQSPIGCVPGGHDCWHRVIDLTSASSQARLPATALHEALDFLSVVWKMKFSAAQRLVNVSSASGLAEIVLGCSTPEDFRSRMNAYKDLLDSVAVDTGLITSAVSPTGNPTLNRLQAALKSQLPQAEFDRADLAITVLRHIVDIRNGLHHAEAAKKIPGAAVAVGITWPPSDWGETWSQVRDTAARAVEEIRKAIQAAP